VVDYSKEKVKHKKQTQKQKFSAEFIKELKVENNSQRDTITKAQNHLGVVDLTQIITTHKMPDDKSLSELIEFYLDNKDKDPAPTPTRTTLELGEPNEILIVNQIIQECDLGLNENSTLTQVINRIKKLIKTKPRPVFKSIVQNDTPFGESLEKIIQIDLNSLEKELGINLSKRTKEQFEKANNYQELSQLRNQEIKSYLEKGSGDLVIKPTQQVGLVKEERIF